MGDDPFARSAFCKLRPKPYDGFRSIWYACKGDSCSTWFCTNRKFRRNTGNIGRTCVVTGARLHLIGPLGFSLDHKTVHRAGLGYWENLDVRTYESWEDFLRQNELARDDERLHLLTKGAPHVCPKQLPRRRLLGIW